MIAELKWNQRLKPSELRKLQEKRLRAMIEHSYKNVKYYHSLFKEVNLSYNDIKTIDDLEKIPITRKEDIIDLPQQSLTALNVDPNSCIIKRTSGTSTGIPLTIYRQKSAMLFKYLQFYRWQLNCGDKITNRQLFVNVDYVPIHSIQKRGLFRAAKNISVFDDVETQIREVTQFNPQTILCIPSFIDVFAKEIRERGEKGINPNLIFTGSEMLTQYVRNLVREVFNAEIFSGYGATEVGGISRECVEHVGFHVESDSTLVEITRDGEPVSRGEEGEITVTNLTNYAMPFIRYNMGDIGSMIADHCSCGISFPLMKITLGRKNDVVRLSEGRMIPALHVWGNLVWIQGIKQLQVVQEKVDHFIIKIVKSNNFTTETCKEAEQMLRQKLGNVEDVKIEVCVVDEIQREKSGRYHKLKQFVTKIPSKDN
jgi:phenylacetate-CoA ligase